MSEIQKVTKLTDEKWLNLYAASFRHGDHNGRWIFASRKPGDDPYKVPDRCDAVLIAAILHEPGRPPRLVLVKEYRVPIGGYAVGLPAGLLDPGEGVEDTVRRELREETGFEVTAVRRITSALYSTPGLTDEAAAMAYVDCTSTPGGKADLQDSEDIEVLTLDYEEVCRMCDRTDLRFDAKAWMTLYMYKQLGKLA
jgi:ADP-ribose pyrophosphatase